jgi:hypothetical protein
MKKVLITILGVSALFAAMSLNGCGTEPKGMSGTFTLSDTVVTGTNLPITITLKDADVTDTMVPVNVTSSADAVGFTIMLTGKNGVFTGTLSFTTTASAAPAIQVFHNGLVTLTYRDYKPEGYRTETLIWKGAVGSVALDQAAYTSIAAPMVITVTDLDMAATSLTVSVTTTTYTSPVNVVLQPVAGSYGTYSKSVYFTPETRLTLGDTIHVKSGDVVTVTYADQIPAGTDVTKTATWTGVAGTVALDSADAGYHGMSSTATITLTDADLTASTVNVTVTSKKDAVGITVALTGAAGSYSGHFGFNMSTSVAGTTIAAQDSDLITISYADAEPAGTITKTANWYSNLVKAIGIFGPGATPGATFVPGLLPKFFNWGPGTCTEETVPNFTGTGTTIKLTAGTMGWAGFGWTQVTDMASLVTSSINMTAYAACSLHVRLKGTATDINLLVENNVHAGQTWVSAATYGYVGDDAWHEVVVPLSAWAATCDLSGVSYFLGATFAPATAGLTITVDDLYWTLP